MEENEIQVQNETDHLLTEQKLSQIYTEVKPKKQVTLNNVKQKFHDISPQSALSLFPIVNWLPKYNLKANLSTDIVTGLTIGVLLLPQGLSYGLLAGLPAFYGLYACLVAPCVYAMFGTCADLHIGPFALVSLLVADTVGAVDDIESDEYIDAVLTVSMLSGIFLFVLGMLRLGVIVEFLAGPVMSGLTTAGAILIATSQLKHFFGLHIPSGTFVQTMTFLFSHLGDVNPATVTIGIISLVLQYSIDEINQRFKKLKKIKLPSGLIVMVLGVLIVKYAQLDEKYGVAVLGDIPSGIPSPRIPGLLNRTGELLVPAIVIGFVGYAITIATAKTFAAQKGYDISSNQELFALGLANFFASFFLGYPAFGSLSRSAVVNALGAKTPLHNFFSTLVVVLTLLFFTSTLYYLPYAILSSVILLALKSLLRQLKEPLRLWKIRKSDGIVWVITFFATLGLQIVWGLAIGVSCSIFFLLQSISRPHTAILKRLPNMEWLYKDSERFSGAVDVPGALIFRFDSPLHFANKDYFYNKVRKSMIQRFSIAQLDEFGLSNQRRHSNNKMADEEGIEEECGMERNDAGDDGESQIGPSYSELYSRNHYVRRRRRTSSLSNVSQEVEGLRFVIIDASSITDMDSAAYDTIKRLEKDCSGFGIELVFCNCRGRFRDVFGVTRPLYLTIDDAVQFVENTIANGTVE